MTSPFSMQRDLILFFCPEASVKPHFVTMCVLAKALQNAGAFVCFAVCPALFHRCPVMDMFQLNHDSVKTNRTLICENCINSSIETLQKYDLPFLNLGDYIDATTIESVEAQVKQHTGSYLDFNFENIPFGKIGFGDYALVRKNWAVNTNDPEQRKAWEQYTTSAITSYLSLSHICHKLRVQRILRFNEYSNNLGAYFAGKKYQIPVFTVTNPSHFGNDLQKAMIFPRIWIEYLQQELPRWPIWREVALSAKLVNEITEDIFYRLFGDSTFAFSTAKSTDASSLRSRLNLNSFKKLLVAFTSSPDERNFVDQILNITGFKKTEGSQAFNDQTEWLKYLIDFVEKSEDLQLLVRIHPREGSTTRYGGASEHLHMLKNNFSADYRNTRIIWPEDPISSYDLIEFADVGLTSWSTLGIEMARLGVPVVSSFRDISFPDDDFHRWGGPTPDDYLQTVRTQINWQPDISSLARAYRCYNKYRLEPYVSVDDIFLSQELHDIPDLTEPIAATQKIARAVIDYEDLAVQNLQELRDNADLAAEHAALKRSYIRIIWRLLVGTDLPDNVQVNVENIPPSNSTTRLNNNTIYLTKFNTLVIQTDTLPNTIEKSSPLAARLVRTLIDESATFRPGEQLINHS